MKNSASYRSWCLDLGQNLFESLKLRQKFVYPRLVDCMCPRRDVMKIVPIDITSKSFTRKMMGYDPAEVSEFLNAVAQELESVIHERNRLKEALREKELQLLEYKDRDRVLKDTITTAQKMSEKIKTETDREAQLILQDAHHKAE